jgi:hypothetical protein
MATTALAPITKTAWWHAAGRRECCEAETTDGRWLFARIEDADTTWLVFATGAASPTTRHSTLRGCRRWVATR